MDQPFEQAKWIWSPNHRKNHYALFVRSLELPGGSGPLRARVSASCLYELFINGEFICRGPTPCDPRWCQFDEFVYTPRPDVTTLHFAFLVYHSSDTYVHCRAPAPGGLIAEVRGRDILLGSDESWKRLDLDMWSEDAPERGWALAYMEDYDARLEPEGWADMVFPRRLTRDWPSAVAVENADATWTDYGRRMTPLLERDFVQPRSFRAFSAASQGAADIGEVSLFCDSEPLSVVRQEAPFDLDEFNASLPRANAFTLDLGVERVGFYTLDVTAPAGVVIEMSGAELLREGRPWIFRKGVNYSIRFRTREGRQSFTSFSWSGFRYLHVVVRGDASGVRFHRLGCVERKAPLIGRAAPSAGDPELARVSDLCRHTLETCALEHLIDCPTREQTQYWGDAVFIAQSLWKGFGAREYLEWYLECFLHAPVNEDGQIPAAYPSPSEHVLLDYTLIPLIGQRFHWQNTGAYFKPDETVERALLLKRWYDRHTNDAGVIEFDHEGYSEKKQINFIDHPGVPWHDFTHPGIERAGASCPLSAFFCGYLRILADMTDSLGRPEARGLAEQADRLDESIRREFFDGTVFHDAKRDGVLSEGTSWQTNSLAVYFDIIKRREARAALRAMLDGYDRLCRCTPYFHFYFLWALRKADMEREAVRLIKKEWGRMIERGATTTWECFDGGPRDSLCHPWATAPFLFLLEAADDTGESRT